MPDVIDKVHGGHRFLSNFWPAPLVLGGILYPTVEHPYVATKTQDRTVRARIACMDTPGQAKRFGRMLPLRDEWVEGRIEIMETLVYQKFLGRRSLADALVNTLGSTLDEAPGASADRAKAARKGHS